MTIVTGYVCEEMSSLTPALSQVLELTPSNPPFRGSQYITETDS